MNNKEKLISYELFEKHEGTIVIVPDKIDNSKIVEVPHIKPEHINLQKKLIRSGSYLFLLARLKKNY